jgi:hypothetical protein
MEMSTLMDVPMSEKRYLLIEKTIQWFSVGRTDAEIARYLAVAGLTPEESQDLVREIHTGHQAHFKTAQGRRHDIGLALLGLGAMCFLVTMFALPAHRKGPGVWATMICVFIGLAVIYGASRSPGQSALNPENEKK